MYHSVLGFSPQIGLSYAFGKEKIKTDNTAETEAK